MCPSSENRTCLPSNVSLPASRCPARPIDALCLMMSTKCPPLSGPAPTIEACPPTVPSSLLSVDNDQATFPLSLPRFMASSTLPGPMRRRWSSMRRRWSSMRRRWSSFQERCRQEGPVSDRSAARPHCCQNLGFVQMCHQRHHQHYHEYYHQECNHNCAIK